MPENRRLLDVSNSCMRHWSRPRA